MAWMLKWMTSIWQTKKILPRNSEAQLQIAWGRQVNGYVYLQNDHLGMEVQAQGLWVPMQKGTSERVTHHHRTCSHLWTL